MSFSNLRKPALHNISMAEQTSLRKLMKSGILKTLCSIHQTHTTIPGLTNRASPTLSTKTNITTNLQANRTIEE